MRAVLGSRLFFCVLVSLCDDLNFQRLVHSGLIQKIDSWDFSLGAYPAADEIAGRSKRSGGRRDFLADQFQRMAFHGSVGTADDGMETFR